MEKFHISLPSDMAEYVRAQVAAGRYESDEAFFMNAVQRDQIDSSDWLPPDDVMRAMIQESLDDPRPSLSSEEVRTRMKALHERTIASNSTDHA